MVLAKIEIKTLRWLPKANYWIGDKGRMKVSGFVASDHIQGRIDEMLLGGNQWV